MAKKNQKKQRLRTNLRVLTELPPGVKLVRTLEGHQNIVSSLAFDPQGNRIVSGSFDTTMKFWETDSGKLLRTVKGNQQRILGLAIDPQGNRIGSGSADGTVTLWAMRRGKLLHRFKGHRDSIRSLAFNPQGDTLASASDDKTVKLWDASTGRLLHTLTGHQSLVTTVAFGPQRDRLASASIDNTVKLWEPHRTKLLCTLEAHRNGVFSLAFDAQGGVLATGGGDDTVKVWETRTAKLLRTLEGHTNRITSVAFSSNGFLLASQSEDHTIRLWSCETWETVAIIPATTIAWFWLSTLTFHPTLPLLASASSPTYGAGFPRDIHLWELDYGVLLGKHTSESAALAVHHTTGKIVVVGDHSVGKSALGHRLIHGDYKEQASTHGQQFWVFPALSKLREDGTECEAILWDFAGQPDYRLVHALFVDNADLALVLFDASDIHDPLHGVGFWLKQLQTGQSRCPIILVAAQTDRGTSPLTADELTAFCTSHGIVGPIATSALTGGGIDELIDRMKSLIRWEEKATTVTTTTFKRIKDYVLSLKGTESQIIVTPDELRKRLEATDAEWQFTDDELLTAVSHSENYGYVKLLRTSKGEIRILLEPERLNNLASSFVLEARRNPKGLGALEEKRLLNGGYDFPEVRDLVESERDVLLDSAALLFLEHNVCFRETDPLRMEPYLVFPELINLKKPLDNDAVTEDAASYTATGPTENVFASLVVLLGYTHTFTRTAQWQNNARYEVGESLVCGFRQEAERDGALDLVLCFGPKVGQPVRTLFQGLFESFLARRNLTVQRYETVRCSNNHLLNRVIVREAMQQGYETTFCPRCGEKLTLPPMAEPIQLTREVQDEVEAQRRIAEQRTRFEQAVFRLHAYIEEQKITPPECFISYAWGQPDHERWVEKRLVDDLLKAGLQIVFDRRENQIGDSLTRFISRIPYCASVVVVGTPLYFQKFENRLSSTGSVVAAEVDLISQRLIATQEEKRTVKTLLLAGEKKTSLPPLMWDAIHADFRNDESYFTTAFDLILSLYDLPPTHPAVADLRESLQPPGFAFRN